MPSFLNSSCNSPTTRPQAWRRTFTFLTLALGILLGTGAQALEPVILQLGGTINFGKAGYVAAIEKGFYADEGLQVEILRGIQKQDKLQALTSGKAQFSNSGAEAISIYIQGAPLVALAAIYQETGYSLVVRHDSGIATPHDLAGKTIAIRTERKNTEVLAMLQGEGVQLDQIQFLTHGVDLHAEHPSQYLIDKTADAIIMRTDALEVFAESQLPVRTIRPPEYGYRFYQNMILTSHQFLNEQPQTVKAFYDATIRGWRYAITHPNEIISIYYEKYPEANLTEEDILGSLTNEAISVFERIGVEGIGALSLEQLQHMAAYYSQLEGIDSPVPLENFIYEPNPTPSLAWVKWVTVAGLSAILLAFGISAWNRQLARRVTERTQSLKLSEKRLKLMMKELDHRVKNNLASVISLSNRTLATSETLGEYGESFLGRLKTMARTHEALTQEHWQGIDLYQAAQLAMHGHLGTQNQPSQHNPITLQGPEVILPSNIASPFCMVLHELTTNAAKHGALSTPQGHIQLTWDTPHNNAVTLHWQEIDGPPINQPLQHGTGMNLIKGLIEYELRGQVTFQSNQQGLTCKLHIPCLELQQAS